MTNLRFNGLNRAADDGEPFSQRVVDLHFNRMPTDDELRALHVYMRYFSGNHSSPDPRIAEVRAALSMWRNGFWKPLYAMDQFEKLLQGFVDAEASADEQEKP